MSEESFGSEERTSCEQLILRFVGLFRIADATPRPRSTGRATGGTLKRRGIASPPTAGSRPEISLSSTLEVSFSELFESCVLLV